jgi:hypothetical protein
VAHDKDPSIGFPKRAQIKLKSLAIKPSGAWFVVVPEREPEPFELSNLFGVFVSLKVDDVGDAQFPQLRHIIPRRYRAAKGQPFGYKEDFQPGTTLLACLEINCFLNAKNSNLRAVL